MLPCPISFTSTYRSFFTSIPGPFWHRGFTLIDCQECGGEKLQDPQKYFQLQFRTQFWPWQITPHQSVDNLVWVMLLIEHALELCCVPFRKPWRYRCEKKYIWEEMQIIISLVNLNGLGNLLLLVVRS